MGFQPDYHTEAVIYAKHILANVKDAKIGVLMQNDDYGKDYWEGFKEGLGKEANRVVKHVTYEITEPTVDSQIIQLKAADANVFFNIATPKFAAQAIRKIADLGWKPVHYVNNVAASVGSVMKPAGFDNVQGILTAAYVMDPTDSTWANNPDMPSAVVSLTILLLRCSRSASLIRPALQSVQVSPPSVLRITPLISSAA